MLATLLDFGGDKRVGFVDAPQTRQHLGKLGWRNGFDGYLQNRFGHMLDGSENMEVLFNIERSKSGGFGNRDIDTTDEDEVSSRYFICRDEVSGDEP